ncbi:MAG: glutathione S-transferase family protein [Gammaproteobacteria bacterium]|nr:glutathione S-transferase family protein [Gammaproteobacteria bacterium]
MKLFWAPQTRSTRAIWMLEEADLDYDMELVDIRRPDRKDSEEFLGASPMGKVPAIVDDDAAMSESAAICIYIADRYAAGRLAPAVDAASRGKYLYWTIYTPAVVEPAVSEKLSKVEPNRVRSGWGDFDSMIRVLDEGLEGKDWILGDQFTAADVMLGSSAVFMRLFEMLPETKNIAAYADRCLARPAFQKATELASG